MAEKGVVNKVSFSMEERGLVKKVSVSMSGKRRGQKSICQHGCKEAWSKKYVSAWL
jgi:hypothetical protein